MWTLNDGLLLIRGLQQDCRRFGYHLALGGGVLNRGQSNKDLDLYFHPLENTRSFPKADPYGLVEWLSTMWGQPRDIGGDPSHTEETDLDQAGSSYTMKLTFFRSSDQCRIDVFVVG